MSAEFLPFLLALGSASLFALGAQFQHIGLATVGSRIGAAISITTAALFHWMMAPWMLDWSHWTKAAVLIFVAVGVFRPSLSANLSVSGTRFLGPTLSSALGSTSPLFGVALGVLWLGEVFTWQIGIGTIGIIAAVLVLSLGNLRVESSWPIWALALPVGAALIRALAHVFSKIGMEEIPDPYFVGLVGFSVSAVIALTAAKISRSAPAPNWRMSGPYWFVIAGFMFGTAIISLNNALLRGDITTVVPIIAMSPIFSMLLSIFVFKREKLTTRVVIAVLMVVPSVAFIALNR